ncbi:DUF6152 family protein, partial [Klebsiella quasivariicola]|uniref:DUF6152 family protein n=2 Tax=Klebsiella quasivariicola TaxID=2026240 RepID=UPI001C557428
DTLVPTTYLVDTTLSDASDYDQTVHAVRLRMAVFGMTTNVFAHHGFSGKYDKARPVWLHGTIRTAVFQYPHAIVNMSVQPDDTHSGRPASAIFLSSDPVSDPEYKGRTVRLEFPPVSRFNSLENQIKPGDSVSVIAFRNCEKPHQLRVQWIRLSDGSEVARSGPVQTEVEGCTN